MRKAIAALALILAVSSPANAQQLDKSASIQAERADFIHRAIQNGAFTKVEVPGNFPRVWIAPNFYTLTFDQKQRFISVVYAYYFDGTDDTDTVRLIDGRSGNEVGRYSIAAGGLDMF